MTSVSIFFTFAIMLVALGPISAREPQPRFRTGVETKVIFQTTNKGLQGPFDAAVEKLQANLVQFTPSIRVLVEGGGYANACIETQLMRGEMFARHDVQVSLNNQVVFMLGQREDGRLPGMVIAGDTVVARGWDKNPREGYAWFPKHHLAASYEMFQGYCFPEPAWRVYSTRTQRWGDTTWVLECRDGQLRASMLPSPPVRKTGRERGK